MDTMTYTQSLFCKGSIFELWHLTRRNPLEWVGGVKRVETIRIMLLANL